SEHEGHARLLNKALASSEGMVVPPFAGSAEDGEAANPTGSLLILAPLVSHERRYGVIEIFQRPVGGAVMHRGFLRFVMEVCELASNYLKRCELTEYAGRQALWSQLEDFCRAVHSGLDVRQVALIVANEGRRLVGCDRLSVAVMRGHKPRIAAISGQETFDRRSSAVRLLDRLIKVAIVGQEPVWYCGDTSDMSPQLEKVVNEYVEGTEHAKSVGVLPLTRGGGNANDGDRKAKRRRPETVGALVVEQFQQARMPEDMLERLRVVQEHAALALNNAQEHDGLFLMPVWKALGRCRAVVAARSLSILAIVGCVAALGAAMALVPVDFEIEARGTLQPVVRREIFVREAGVVANVLVDHAQQVKQGDGLVELRNRDLEVSITDLVGRRTATDEQVAALRRARNDSRLNFEEQNRLAGQIKQLEKTSESLVRQLDLLVKKQQLLKLTSPIDGQVVTWDVKNLLQERPVEKGQIVMSVANTAGPWELELHVRENRSGYVARA
ncbi:MAG: efflux RND transporter periplasmic adaptor subunit, partial [Planctomycetes bacterium]|nr:efflux RND transporter periplasmic adaptor subunit [Planctomycetota bacterium]